MAWKSAVAAVLFTLGAVPALAAEIPKDGVTVQEVASGLQQKGYKGEIKTSDDGKQKYVDSATDGYSFGVWLYDCKADRCGSLQFETSFTAEKPVSLADVNAWNRDFRWARGYLSKDGHPHVESDVDLTPGGTWELLDDNLGIWNSTIDGFSKMVFKK